MRPIVTILAELDVAEADLRQAIAAKKAVPTAADALRVQRAELEPAKAKVRILRQELKAANAWNR